MYSQLVIYHNGFDKTELAYYDADYLAQQGLSALIVTMVRKPAGWVDSTCNIAIALLENSYLNIICNWIW